MNGFIFPYNDFKNEVVKFWSASGTYGCFSNWKSSKFELDGMQFANAEQAIMYKKAVLFGDKNSADLIATTTNPKEVKALGRAVSGFSKDIWEKSLIEICLPIIEAKFTQNEDMLKVLLSTDDKIIAEASPLDNIWGIGTDARDERSNSFETFCGTNYLGILLMLFREKYKKERGL